MLFHSNFDFAVLWKKLIPRRFVLQPPLDKRRGRLVISNSRNPNHHQLEKGLARLICRICLLESNNFRLSRSVTRAVQQLNDSLICGNIGNAMRWCEVVRNVASQVEQENKFNGRGPLLLAGLEFHGFISGCSPATTLISLKDNGLGIIPLWEHDLSAAFESADLSLLIQKDTVKQLGIPVTLSLVAAVMSSALIERRALLSVRTFLAESFAAASIKQFPDLRPGVTRFGHNQLIQGSPLSPILFNIYLAVTSLGDGLRKDSQLNQKFWVYGDNVYTTSYYPPSWPNCRWKPAVMLGHEGTTLGLAYKLASNGRLVVTHPNISYATGVQRKLDEHWRLHQK